MSFVISEDWILSVSIIEDFILSIIIFVNNNTIVSMLDIGSDEFMNSAIKS